MSLVEKALRKLQESSRVAPTAPDVVIPLATPSVVDTRSARAAVAAEVPAPPRHTPPPRDRIDLNFQALRAAGLLAPEHQELEIANQYRQIKRPLIANAIGRGVPKLANGHLIMMASALPGDGKTFTSVNLAMSLAAERDISVLLVDADVAKPHISRMFGLDQRPGLLDALQDESLDVESLIVDTNIRGLSMLPAGRHAHNATELLASSYMERIVAQLGAFDPHRIMLLDSPPLLLTNESRALAGIVGQIVIVVRAGFTPQQAVLDAISHLGEGKSIGLILNQNVVGSSEVHYYGQSAYGDQQVSKGQATD